MDMYEHSSSSLNTYLDSPVLFYAKSRNFDFGPCNRQNVSNLSKFISHRIILEYDLVLRALEKHKFQGHRKIYSRNFLESLLERMARAKAASLEGLYRI